MTEEELKVNVGQSINLLVESLAALHALKVKPLIETMVKESIRAELATSDCVREKVMQDYVTASIKEATCEDAMRETVENVFEGIKDSRRFKNFLIELIDVPDVDEAVKSYFEDNSFRIEAT